MGNYKDSNPNAGHPSVRTRKLKTTEHRAVKAQKKGKDPKAVVEAAKDPKSVRTVKPKTPSRAQIKAAKERKEREVIERLKDDLVENAAKEKVIRCYGGFYGKVPKTRGEVVGMELRVPRKAPGFYNETRMADRVAGRATRVTVARKCLSFEGWGAAYVVCDVCEWEGWRGRWSGT